MLDILFDLARHELIAACFFAWLAAQLVKVALSRSGAKGLVRNGGMPSAHAALVAALATGALMIEGVSVASILAVVFAIVVIRDAVGVRRLVGQHSGALNKIGKERFSTDEGHTIPQVAAGALLGILMAWIIVGYQVTLFLFVQIAYLMLPAIGANIAPVLAKRLFPQAGWPIDGGARMGKEPLLGKNKTWRGLVAGILAAIAIMLLQGMAYEIDVFHALSLVPYHLINLWMAGILVGVGVLGADLIKSFCKRRARIPPGASWPPWDQVDSVIGGVLVAAIYIPSIGILVIASLMGVGFHIALNALRKDLGWL